MPSVLSESKISEANGNPTRWKTVSNYFRIIITEKSKQVMQKYHLQNRPNREIISQPEIIEILKKGKYAVISMCANNEPYIVTLSYGFDELRNTLYFHCSKQGLKLDFIKKNPRVCATIIEDGGYIQDECGHKYKTAVFWGDMKFVSDLDEKKHGMSILLNHLENKPEIIGDKLSVSDTYYDKMEVLKLKIIQIHAKAGR